MPRLPRRTHCSKLPPVIYPHMKRALLPLSALIGLSACMNASEPRTSPNPVSRLDWREIATASDRDRLRRWRTAWISGVARAEAAGHGAEISREGALLQPDAAIAWQAPQPGEYQCRTLKIGARSEGMLNYVAYSPFTCRVRVEDGLVSFAKLTGSQRPLGLFLPDNGRRMIFLGTLQLGDEKLALQYGRDRERDMAGVLERIGERRWRLVFPYPHFESTLDVLELVPRAPPASPTAS